MHRNARRPGPTLTRRRFVAGLGAAAADVLKFFDWAYKNGDAAANQLAYVPLPVGVKNAVRKAAWSQIKSGGKPVFTGK